MGTKATPSAPTYRRTSHFIQESYDWEQSFDVCESKDVPYLEQISWQDGGAIETIVENFMYIRPDAPECAHEIEEMRSMCPDSHLDALKGDHTDKIPSSTVAWLDDRDKDGRAGLCNGPLSVRDLHSAAKSRVCHTQDPRYQLERLRLT